MGKHNDLKFQTELQQTFRDKLQGQLKNGLARGMYAACKVINEKATNEEKTPEERIAEIIEFCKWATRPVEGVKEPAVVKP